MDTALANILSDTSLDQPSRLLYAVLHACTNGSGAGEMPVDEALTRLGASNIAYLRRLRSQLLTAGYLDSHVTDGTLYWTLLAIQRAPQARSDAQSAPVRRAETDESAPVERAGAPVERAGAPVERAGAPVERANAPVERANAPVRRAEPATSWLVGSNTTDHGPETNQPVADDDPGAEMRRTYALLRDPEVDVAEIAARRIAKAHRFWYVLQQVFSWRHARARGMTLAPGAIVNRLDNSWRPDDLTDADRASELYQRHVSAELAAEQTAAELRKRYNRRPVEEVLNQSASALRRRYGRGGS